MAAFCEGIDLVDHGDGVDGPKNEPQTPSRGIIDWRMNDNN